MTVNLTQRQRLIVAVVYLALLWIAYLLIARFVPGASEHAVFWFYSAALLIVLGRYVVEPYFTTPADAIVNALTLLITLNALPPADRSLLLGYQALWYYGWSVMGFAGLAIFTKDFRHPILRTISRSSYQVAELAGKAHVMFSALYLSASYSYFGRFGHLLTYINTLALWICVTFFDIVGKMVYELTRSLQWLKRRIRDELGHAIGCDNPLLYKVEVDYTKYKGRSPQYGDIVAIETKANTGAVGMIVARKHLLSKSWLSVYLLTSPAGELITLDLRRKKLTADPQSIFAAENKAFFIDIAQDLDLEDRARVEHTSLFAYKDNFVGYITKDSNINTVSFIILRDRDATNREICEGVILKTSIYGDDTLYQVINGNTREEHLVGFDSHGYTVGVARKLGRYNAIAHELETRKWMPGIYAPLFFGYAGALPQQRIQAIAQSAIGRLPETDLEVQVKDIDAIVTHNTAILGILGIGKSCLSYELIRRVVGHGVKVICIDVTNEYKRELQPYVPEDGAIVSDNENAFNTINARFEYIHVHNDKQIPDRSGNFAEYRAELRKDLCNFLFSSETIPNPPVFHADRRVRIYNVDYHKASRGEKIGFNVITVEMTQAEKTRVIAEELFKILMRIPLEDEKRAKVLIVFEEAHSLIPEWNSVASEGDKNATNGTAKIILQGRKYGLGSLVITQRTANVSKSILNQCNTIFALRVFDDTGKSFLENYIGKDYADTLATLDERHAIAIGKGLRLKQPVIIRLNERTDVLPVPVAPVGVAPVVVPN